MDLLPSRDGMAPRHFLARVQAQRDLEQFGDVANLLRSEVLARLARQPHCAACGTRLNNTDTRTHERRCKRCR